MCSNTDVLNSADLSEDNVIQLANIVEIAKMTNGSLGSISKNVNKKKKKISNVLHPIQSLIFTMHTFLNIKQNVLSSKENI